LPVFRGFSPFRRSCPEKPRKRDCHYSFFVT
jgi:hypothetical protein